MKNNWNWIDRHKKAQFTSTNGIQYNVIINHIPSFAVPGKNNKGMSFSFVSAANNSVKKTGTGNAFEVFSTVGEIIRATLNENPDIAICFSSDPDEEGRVSLYGKLAKRLANHLDRKFTSDEIPAGKCNLVRHWILPIK